jgi:uncharacterized protein YxjI
VQYLIREQANPLSREIVIEDRHGQCVYRAHGPVVRMRDELHVENASGVEEFLIKEPVLGDRSRFELRRQGKRRPVAVISRVEVGNLLEGFDVDVTGGEKVHARGDMFGREFSLMGTSGSVGQVRRHNERSVELETGAGQDEALLVASVLAIFAMTDAWARSRR